MREASFGKTIFDPLMIEKVLHLIIGRISKPIRRH